jgi:uncharacterized coiled-coil DUF342 family protein
MTEQEEESTTLPQPSPEELEMGEKITDLANQIKEAKTAGKSKEEWDPFLKEMLGLKVRDTGQACVRESH